MRGTGRVVDTLDTLDSLSTNPHRARARKGVSKNRVQPVQRVQAGIPERGLSILDLHGLYHRPGRRRPVGAGQVDMFDREGSP